MKRKIVLSLSLILIIILSLGATIYAWFGLLEKTPPIIIEQGTLKLGSKLYDEDDNEITEITIETVVPGDVYLYKLVITNKGTLDGNLEVVFNFNSNNEVLLSLVQFELYDPSSGSKLFSDENFTYESDLDGKDSLSLYFKVTFLTALTYDDLIGDDYIEIESIVITLIQKEIVMETETP